MPKTSLQPILFLSPVEFHQLRQRHQALAQGLSEAGFPVTFVNPLRSPGFSCVIQPLDGGLREVNVRVPFRAAQYPGWQALASSLAMALLKRKGFLRPEQSLLWIADPSLSHFVNAPWKAIVYDRCDRHGSFPGQRKKAWLDHERRIYQRATATVVSSPVLFKEAQKQGVRSLTLVPNAAPKAWTQPPFMTRPAAPPLRLLSSGAHYEWTDIVWLTRFLTDPRCELHIAGPGRGALFEALLRHPRVVSHGTLSHAHLLELLDTCHIGLIPFTDMELIQGVDPVKSYEFAARRLAVWATDVASLRHHPMVTRIVKKSDSIPDVVDRFLTQPVFSPVQPVPTWEDRVEAIVKVVKGLTA